MRKRFARSQMASPSNECRLHVRNPRIRYSVFIRRFHFPWVAARGLCACILVAALTSCSSYRVRNDTPLFHLEEIIETPIPYDLLSSGILSEWLDGILVVPMRLDSSRSLHGFFVRPADQSDQTATTQVIFQLPHSIDSRSGVWACVTVADTVFMVIGTQFFVFTPLVRGSQIVMGCDTTMLLATHYTSILRSRNRIILVADTYQHDDTVGTLDVAAVDIHPVRIVWARTTRAIDGYPLLLFRPRRIAAMVANAIVIADVDRYRLRLYDGELRLISTSEGFIQGWASHGRDIHDVVRAARSEELHSLIDSLRIFAYDTWSVRRVDAVGDSLLLVTLQTPYRVDRGVMTEKPALRYDLWVRRGDSLVPTSVQAVTPSPSDDEIIGVSRKWPPGDLFFVTADRIVRAEPCLTNEMLRMTYAEAINSVKTRLVSQVDPSGTLVFISTVVPNVVP